MELIDTIMNWILLIGFTSLFIMNFYHPIDRWFVGLAMFNSIILYVLRIL